MMVEKNGTGCIECCSQGRENLIHDGSLPWPRLRSGCKPLLAEPVPPHALPPWGKAWKRETTRWIGSFEAGAEHPSREVLPRDSREVGTFLPHAQPRRQMFWLRLSI